MSRIIEFRKSAQKAAKQSVQGKTCAFTGHRPQSLPFGFDESDKRCTSLKSVMRDQIVALIENEGVTHFINVPRLLLLCACLPARRFVAWNAPRLADDGDALDAVIDKLVVPVLPQLRDGLVRQLFLQRSCIFNCHLESSYQESPQIRTPRFVMFV